MRKWSTRGNRGEEAEFKVWFPDWIINTLRTFRLGVYPHMRVLIDLLPDDHPAKAPAFSEMVEGRSLLLEEQKDQATPHWRLREADTAWPEVAQSGGLVLDNGGRVRRRRGYPGR